MQQTLVLHQPWPRPQFQVRRDDAFAAAVAWYRTQRQRPAPTVVVRRRVGTHY